MKKSKTIQNIVESNNECIDNESMRSYIKSCVLEELENLSGTKNKTVKKPTTKKNEVIFDEKSTDTKLKQKAETITCKCGKEGLKSHQMNMHLNSVYHKNNI